MSEYVRKHALLDRLDELIGYFGGNSFLARALKRTMEEIQSGAYDVPDGEVQRLRAAFSSQAVFKALRYYQKNGMCEGDEYDEIEAAIEAISGTREKEDQA